MRSAIYETTGRAKEFCDLALNHYAGCGHACVYCYGVAVTHVERETFNQHPYPRLTTEDIWESAKNWKGPKTTVLMSFVTDPYQPIEADLERTRKAIGALHQHGFPVTILTKAGELARRDFDLLNPKTDTFATTLTCIKDADSLKWEPGAGLPQERLTNLKAAHDKGFATWVSLEPVIDPEQTFMLVQDAAPDTDLFKVGTMNYHPHGKTIDWKKYGCEVVGLLQSLRKPYYLKDDLRKAMGIMPDIRIPHSGGNAAIGTQRTR